MASALKTIRMIAVGGNSELSTASGPASLRQMTADPDTGKRGEKGGALGKTLGLHPFPTVHCTYFSWTGDPREDTWMIPVQPGHLVGHIKIDYATGSIPAQDKLLIVGWSNGGDTAYKLARRIGKQRSVDMLMTLDPVSRVTSAHWLPFMGTFEKPTGVAKWFHAYTTSWGSSYHEAKAREESRLTLAGKPLTALKERLEGTGPTDLGNVIAAVGGAWNSQTNADINLPVAGNHGHTMAMLSQLTATPTYQAFLKSLREG